MAKGAATKLNITNKILETFPNSFLYDNKEIRIPAIEDGAEVQIKVTLTCAKVNVDAEGAVPANKETAPTSSLTNNEITEEEKKETINLIEKLGL